MSVVVTVDKTAAARYRKQQNEKLDRRAVGAGAANGNQASANDTSTGGRP
jgi:hypothetical protein